MFDIEEELRKYGMTRESYESCLEDIYGKISGRNDLDWADIVAKYNLQIHSDTLRKASNTIFGGGFVAEYLRVKNSTREVTDAYMAMLKEEKLGILKERQKLKDEKLEYNRWLREEARDELITEKICEAVDNLPPLETPEPIIPAAGDKAAIVCFADTHYGKEFIIKGLYGETLNEYSPEIFEKRMGELLGQTIEMLKEEGLDKVRVYSLGDEIDGILRVSQLSTLRYGVVESTIRYADYITRWLTELSHHAEVEFHMVEGNHTELRMLGQPKGTFTDDNMSKIIRAFVSIRMEGNPNFRIAMNPSGLIFDNVAGYRILSIHGEVKNLSNAIKDFSNVYGTPIDILIGGHKHHLSTETVGIDREVISVPSVIGLDSYSMGLIKAASAGAVGLILRDGCGIVKQYNFKFGKDN